jgi:hypothetical protein
MSGYGSDDPRNPSLSAEAEHVLEELLAAKKAEILAAASRTGKLRLHSTDIVSAYTVTEKRSSTGLGLALRGELSHKRRDMMLNIVPLFVALLSVIVCWIGMFFQEWAPDRLPVSALTAVSSLLLATFIWVAVKRESLARESNAAERELLMALSEGQNATLQSTGRELGESARQVYFLKLWAKVEDRLRQLYSLHISDGVPDKEIRRPIGSVVARLVSAQIISPELAQEIREIADVRNHIAHQQFIPSVKFRGASDRLTQLEDALAGMLNDPVIDKR